MRPLVIDGFAGGGGASTGISRALGRVDVAINHDPEAIAMHADRWFWPKVRKGDGDSCWEWTGYRAKRRSGAASYGTIGFGGKDVLAHRYAWVLEHGQIGVGLVVCHRCDNVACVRADHLFLGTQAANLADMRAKGRQHPMPQSRGESNARARLTVDVVREIRELRSHGLSLAKIGSRLGVHPTTVHCVVSGKTWRHVA